jgi:hypothetical protein
MNVEISLFRWSMELAAQEASTDLATLRQIPDIGASTFVAALERMETRPWVAVLQALVKAAHPEALAAESEALSAQEVGLVQAIRAQQFTSYSVRPGRTLDARSFRRYIARDMGSSERTVLDHGDSNILVVSRQVHANRVQTEIGLQSRPFYLQTLFDRDGRRLVDRRSFLSFLGVSSQTVLTEARRGEEERVSRLFTALAEKFETWALAVSA